VVKNINEAQRSEETTDYKDCTFFIGGNDLEMRAIKELLEQSGIEAENIVDSNLGWGAKASDYESQIGKALSQGRIPVIIELNEDIELPQDKTCISVDHHGERSGEPSSILQVCKLLGIEPDRRIELIAANDTGWIPGLRATEASDEEIRNIREEDRRMQGFDAELESISEKLANEAEIDEERGLAIAKDLPISKFAGIKDRIAERGIYNVICLASPQGDSQQGEMEFQGDGVICQELNEKYSGWSGGEGLGKPGGIAFWGGYPENPEQVIEDIETALTE